MAEACFKISTRHSEDVSEGFSENFPDLPDPVTAVVEPHPFVANVEYAAINTGVAVVADDTADGEEVAIDFGDVVAAQGFYLRNASGQDLGVEINGAGGGIPTTVSDAIDDVDAAITAQFTILNAFTGASNINTVVAAIATAFTAIDTARDALMAAEGDAATVFTLPHGGAIAAVLPDAATAVESIVLRTTALEQSGDGEVEYRVFGDVAG